MSTDPPAYTSGDVERAVRRVLVRANSRFDLAIAALQPPPTDPPPTIGELWGSLARAFSDGMAQLARDIERGFNQPNTKRTNRP